MAAVGVNPISCWTVACRSARTAAAPTFGYSLRGAHGVIWVLTWGYSWGTLSTHIGVACVRAGGEQVEAGKSCVCIGCGGVGLNIIQAPSPLFPLTPRLACVLQRFSASDAARFVGNCKCTCPPWRLSYVHRRRSPEAPHPASLSAPVPVLLVPERRLECLLRAAGSPKRTRSSLSTRPMPSLLRRALSALRTPSTPRRLRPSQKLSTPPSLPPP